MQTKLHINIKNASKSLSQKKKGKKKTKKKGIKKKRKKNYMCKNEKNGRNKSNYYRITVVLQKLG